MGANEPHDEIDDKGDEKKGGIGKRLLGLFVEKEGEEPAPETAGGADGSAAAQVAGQARADPRDGLQFVAAAHSCRHSALHQSWGRQAPR